MRTNRVTSSSTSNLTLKMRRVYLCVLLAALCVQYAKADCQAETIEEIKRIFKAVEKPSLLKDIEGTYKFVSVNDKELAKECLSATFKDGHVEFKGAVSGSFDIENDEGRLMILDTDELTFIGYFIGDPEANDGVISLFVCSAWDLGLDVYVAFGGTAVRTTASGSNDAAIKSAEEDFAKIGITLIPSASCK